MPNTHKKKMFYVDYVPRKKEWVIRNISNKLILFSSFKKEDDAKNFKRNLDKYPMK